MKRIQVKTKTLKAKVPKKRREKSTTSNQRRGEGKLMGRSYQGCVYLILSGLYRVTICMSVSNFYLNLKSALVFISISIWIISLGNGLVYLHIQFYTVWGNCLVSEPILPTACKSLWNNIRGLKRCSTIWCQTCKRNSELGYVKRHRGPTLD